MYDCDFDVFVILSTFLNFLYEPFAIFFYKKKDTVEQKSNGKMFDALEDNIVNNAH